MSSISIEDVKKLAKLSALTISDTEADALRNQLDEILGFVSKLSEVNTLGIEPTYQVTGLSNVMREDEVVDYGLDRDALLRNTPNQQDGQIKVKRVIE
ncbi:Asp-tRNA(Asn)/Glu-tRNA(Gln) amidotransferase subunit GatC [Candidatus Saccharibacteria bacterium]|nr:Asp-tRNA(Asn)/Glu-tRNA(Gln) amidotransferase subunit GatC [Candidatus Saccharibacteria bacterium]NCU40206.1 Asp-tRNA(Asn)/Glu-tRNA(Gln) amidotransferase subunit GatC [Candidatus Saccharibacteria bacterium]